MTITDSVAECPSVSVMVRVQEPAATEVTVMVDPVTLVVAMPAHPLTMNAPV